MGKFKLSIAATIAIMFLSGCVASTSNENIIDEDNACGSIKPVLSLEQELKKLANEEGFTARIKNHSNLNPNVFAKDFIDLKTELESTNLDFEISNYTDTMNTKMISVYQRGDRYGIDKELMKIEYVATNTKFLTIGEIIKVFAKNQISLNVPYHLQSKIVNLTPNASYKLGDLLNEITNKIISMNTYCKIASRYNTINKTIEVAVILEEKSYNYPEDVSKTLTDELKKYDIAFKRTPNSISILGNYKQQILAQDIIERKLKYYANNYVACKKGFSGYDGIVLKDGIETPLDTFESITLNKISEDENGIENYILKHKTSSGIKEYKLKTNESKIKINKENLNLKIKLY